MQSAIGPGSQIEEVGGHWGQVSRFCAWVIRGRRYLVVMTIKLVLSDASVKKKNLSYCILWHAETGPHRTHS